MVNTELFSSPIFGFVIVMLQFILILFLFRYLLKKRDILMNEELNHSAYYNENCGARFDRMNFTIPFIRVAIYKNFLVLSGFYKYLLRSNEITKVEIKRHLFFHGVHIRHHNENVPSLLIIWSLNSKGVKLKIESMIRNATIIPKQ
jgi:hypothetical protein